MSLPDKKTIVANNMVFVLHVYELQVSSTPQLYRYFDIFMLDLPTKIGLMDWNF